MTDQELKDLVASLAEDQKRVWQRMEETDRRLDKLCGKVGGMDENLGHTGERPFAEVDRILQETTRKLDKLCGKVGGIDENLGHHAEQFFQDVFGTKMEFGGVKYDRMDTNVKRRTRKGEIEVDILLSNGDSVAMIEVKNRIHPKFVTELAQERVKVFRTMYPEYNNYKLYLGIAGFSFSDAVLAKAKENGVGLVKQVGDGVEIEAEPLTAY